MIERVKAMECDLDSDHIGGIGSGELGDAAEWRGGWVRVIG